MDTEKQVNISVQPGSELEEVTIVEDEDIEEIIYEETESD